MIRIRPILDVTALVSTRKVESSTLDDWANAIGIPKADFLKLDVQGAELIDKTDPLPLVEEENRRIQMTDSGSDCE